MKSIITNPDAIGTLPKLQNTVQADILAKLLCGERVTSMTSVFGSSTTRAGAVVHRLEREYGWTISRETKAQGCADGRVSHVSEYFLTDAAIVKAHEAGAGKWIAGVNEQRRKLRQKAAEAKRQAERENALALALKKAAKDLNVIAQGNLFAPAIEAPQAAEAVGVN